MNFTKPFAIAIGLITLVGLTAAGAGATTITKGAFTLPAQTYWNDTLLQPGDYTFTVDRTLSGVEMVHLRGEGVNATLMTQAGALDASGHSHLGIDEVSGTYVVREFEVSPSAKTYRFGVSKTVRNLTLRGDARQTITVPVTTAAGM